MSLIDNVLVTALPNTFLNKYFPKPTDVRTSDGNTTNDDDDDDDDERRVTEGKARYGVQGKVWGARQGLAC